jgi:hypothetical protein
MINTPSKYWPMHKEVWWEEHSKLNFNQRVDVLRNPHSTLGKKLQERVHIMVMDELGLNKKNN